MNTSRYSMKEKKTILEYIISNNAYNDVKGRTFWVDFAKKRLNNRTWQGLKEVFIKRIVTDLHNPYYELSSKEIHSLRSGCGALGKTQNWTVKKETPSTSIKENENDNSLPVDSNKDKTDKKTPKRKNTSLFKVTEITDSSFELESNNSERVSENDPLIALKTQKEDELNSESTQKGATPSKEKEISQEDSSKDIFDDDEVESVCSSDSIYRTCENGNSSNIKLNKEMQKSNKSNKKDLFGFSSGKTFVKRDTCTNHYSNGILIHKCCDNNRNTPRKRYIGECSYKNEKSCVSSSLLCSSDVSDSDSSPLKRPRMSQKQPLFVYYKGELFPVKILNTKYSYSEPLHVHFRHDDKSLYRSNGHSEKNRSDKIFPTRTKYLNTKKPGKSVVDKIYISSDDEFPTDNARYVLDFPDETSELRYYRDMEKYRNGFLQYKPSKEDYQRILNIEEKKNHKKYAHLYKENKLCKRKNVVNENAIEKFDNSVHNRLESIQDMLDGDPECTALYWKLKYLMEKKLNKKLSVQENILNSFQDEIIARNDDKEQQNNDDIQLVEENNSEHKNKKNLNSGKNVCKLSLNKKGKDVFHNTYTLDTEKIDACINILCNNEKPENSKCVEKEKVVENGVSENNSRIIENEKIIDIDENKESKKINEKNPISDVQNNEKRAESPVDDIILKEKAIFEAIKNTSKEEAPVILNENRNLFSTLEVEMYLSGIIPSSEQINTDETKMETPSKDIENVKIEQKPSSSKKKQNLRTSLSSTDSRSSTRKESSNTFKAIENKELKNLVIDMKEKHINRSSRRIKRISPQPMSRRNRSSLNITPVKRKQITKETLNSKEPAITTKRISRFTTTPEKKSIKSKEASLLSKSLIIINNQKDKSVLNMPDLSLTSEKSTAKASNSSLISENNSFLKENDTLIFDLDNIVFIPQNKEDSEKQNKVIASENGLYKKVEIFNLANELKPTDDWDSYCETNSEELFH